MRRSLPNRFVRCKWRSHSTAPDHLTGGVWGGSAAMERAGSIDSAGDPQEQLHVRPLTRQDYLQRLGDRAEERSYSYE
jgi:hypothetical protein